MKGKPATSSLRFSVQQQLPEPTAVATYLNHIGNRMQKARRGLGQNLRKHQRRRRFGPIIAFFFWNSLSAPEPSATHLKHPNRPLESRNVECIKNGAREKHHSMPKMRLHFWRKLRQSLCLRRLCINCSMQYGKMPQMWKRVSSARAIWQSLQKLR